MVSSQGARLGEEAARCLARTGQYEIGPGLTDAEFARIEHDYGFEFADDHRAFLAAGMPLNRPPKADQAWDRPWPDWRGGDPDNLRIQIGWPVDGIVLKVEHGMWLPWWGQRPDTIGEALSSARERLAQVPAMIPVFGHRYLPAGRGTHGHPVLSMWSTDIVIYGTDLADYVDREFSGDGSPISPDWTPPPMVPFWSEFL